MGKWILFNMGNYGHHYRDAVEVVQEEPMDLNGFVAEVGLKLIVSFDNANMFFQVGRKRQTNYIGEDWESAVLSVDQCGHRNSTWLRLQNKMGSMKQSQS